MARVEGLDIGTPSILGDSFDVLERPRKQKGVEVAQVPPELEIEIQRRTPAAPKEPVTPKPGPGEAIREQGRIKMEREERERAETEAKKAAAKAGAAAVAGRRAEIRAEYEPKLAAPAPTFESPRESFNQLGSIAAMMMVMGTMAGGKGLASATGAMNAMAGMLQGYQTGRKEAYQQARLDYERSYKDWLQNKKNIKDAFDRALKMAPTDVQGATNKVVAELSSTGANTLAAAVKTQGLVPTANMFAEASDKADREIESINSVIRRMSGEQPTEVGVQLAGEVPTGTPLTIQELRRREQELGTEIKAQEAERRAAPRAPTARGGADPQFVVVEGFNNNQPFRATREERDRITGAGFNIKYVPSPAAAAGATKQGQNALTFASRVYGNLENAAQDLSNIAVLPATASTPLLSGLIGGDPNTIRNSLTAAAGRTITDVEARAFDQLSQQLGAALARIESQGLASGSTNKTISTFDALRPKAGDDAINMALYLAKVKQEIITGIRVHGEMPGATEGQKRNAQKLIEQMNEVVAFDVNDVINVLRSRNQTLSEKSRGLLNVPPIAPNLQFRGEGATLTPTAPTAPTIAPDDQRALQWLQTNPTHPRAEEIRKRLRDKGVQVQ